MADLTSFMTGVSNSIAARGKQTMAVADAMKTYDDKDDTTAQRSLGMSSEMIQYQNSLMALTNPAQYGALRVAAYKKIAENVETIFKGSYNEMTEAGMPHENAKAMAMSAASSAKALQMAGFNLRFPEKANVISDAGIVRESNAFKVAPNGGRAPAQKRRSKKSKK